MKSKIEIEKLVDNSTDDYFLNLKYEIPNDLRMLGYEILPREYENEEKLLFSLLKFSSFPIYMHVVGERNSIDEYNPINFVTSKVKNSYGEYNYVTVKITDDTQLFEYSQYSYFQVANGNSEIFFSNEKEAEIIVKNDDFILKAPLRTKNSFLLWLTYDATAFHFIPRSHKKFEEYIANHVLE